MKKILQIIIGCFLCFGQFAMAQNRTVVTGKVTTSTGETLPSVSVIVKGTSIGAVSDINGNYTISVPEDGKSVLLFSYIGFDTKEELVGNRSVINVTLVESTKQLSEIVVTAFGISKEKAVLGYSTQTIDGQDLIKAREPNPISGLVGKVAGLTVGISPEMLARPNLLLRGNSDLLYVVDGVPINSDTWNISPDDIKSYTILKGPNAAALYGFRGQNGAIVITTKRGASNSKGFTIDLNSSTMLDRGFISRPRAQNEYGLGNNYQYAFGNDPFDRDGRFPRAAVFGPRFEGQPIPQYDSPIDPETGIRQATPWLMRNADNYGDFVQTGLLTNNNIALGATTDKADLRVSLSNSHQVGIYPNTSLTINNFNISAGYQFSEKLRFEGNINTSFQNSPNVPDVFYGPNSYAYSFGVYGSSHFDVNELRDYWAAPGIPGIQQINREYGRTNNPWFIANEWLKGHKKTDIYGYAKLTYRFNPYTDFSLRTQVTGWDGLRTERFPYSAETYGRPDRRGDYTEDRRSLFENNTDVMLTFVKDITPSFHINAFAGGTARTFNYNSSWLRTNNLVIPGIYNFSNSENPLIGFNFNSNMVVLSGYSSMDISYKKYLTFNATGHWDKLSTLPVGAQSYFYPSASLSSVFSDYIKMPRFISFAKVRGSFANVQGGLVASNIGPSYNAIGQRRPISYGTDWFTSYDGPTYQNQNTFSTSLVYNNQPGANFTGTIANPELKPFSVTSYETGLDIFFLDNRLGLDLTYFTTINGPQIFTRDVANSTGFDQVNVNDIITQKNGWEIALKGTPVLKEKFSWNILFNYSTFVERYKDINDPSGTVFTNGGFFSVGDRVDEVFGRRFLRTPDGQVILNAAGLPVRPPSGPAGNSSLGFGNSDFVWAINNVFSYKAFSFSFQFDGRVGGKIYNDLMRNAWRGGAAEELAGNTVYGIARRQEWESFKENGSITPAFVAEGVRLTGGTIRFDQQGNIVNFDELTFVPNTRAASLEAYLIAISDFDEPWVYSKSFAKLREIIFSYNIPGRVLNKTFINRASVSLVGRNLLYWAARKDMDIDQYPRPALKPFQDGEPRLQSSSTRRFGINLNLTF